MTDFTGTSVYPGAIDNFDVTKNQNDRAAQDLVDARAAINAMQLALLRPYNVKSYGAIGDGVADDAAAIQAAIDAAEDDGGGIVFLPLGIYLILASLYQPPSIRLMGVLGSTFGYSASVIKASASGTYTNGLYTEKFMLKQGKTATGSGFWGHNATIEYLKFDCNDVAGLAGIHGWGAGELSLIDQVHVRHTGVTSRSITDLGLTAGSKIVTSVAGSFTQDDVLGEVSYPATGFPSSWSDTSFTDGAMTKDSDLLTSATASFTSAALGKELISGASSAAGSLAYWGGAYVVEVVSGTQVRMSLPFKETHTGQSLTLTQPRNLRIERVVNATTAWLTRPATATASSQTVTVKRPRPGIQFHSGSATMVIGTVNGVGNSGPLFEIVNGNGGEIHSLTGDNNGCLLKLLSAGAPGNAVEYDVCIKAENNQYGQDTFDGRARHLSYGDQDPPIILDACGMVHLNLRGRASAGERSNHAMVRLQRTLTYAGGLPGVTLHGIEGGNPYNGEFYYSLWDADGSKGIAVPVITDEWLRTPLVLWNRRVYQGGTDMAAAEVMPIDLPSIVDIPCQSPPNTVTQGTFLAAYDGPSIRTTQGYNFTHAVNDEFRWKVVLERGTWRLDVGTRKSTDRAIVTWDISYDDGATWTSIGTQDQYNASALTAQQTPSSSIAVANRGRAVLRARALTKNASSTDFYMIFSTITLTRTA